MTMYTTVLTAMVCDAKLQGREVESVAIFVDFFVNYKNVVKEGKKRIGGRGRWRRKGGGR